MGSEGIDTIAFFSYNTIIIRLFLNHLERIDQSI